MDVAKLHELIVKHFNEEELKTLCFTLPERVDYDSLVGKGKNGKARELIAFCERTGTLSDLIKRCKDLRPRAAWSTPAMPSQTNNALQTNRKPSISFETKPANRSQLKVFLCYVPGDKEKVRQLYRNLKSDGFDPWLDEENLLPGQHWNLEITKAVKSSDAIIVCLSREAVTTRGHVQKQIKIALDVADEFPEGDIFMIPVNFEECDVPERLSHLHSVDLQQETGYASLVKALIACANSLNINIPTMHE